MNSLEQEAHDWLKRRREQQATSTGSTGELTMDFNEYQARASKTAVYPSTASILYPAMGLAGEAGEVCNKIKKVVRGDKIDTTDHEWRTKVGDEMGDVLWYLAALASDLDLNLSKIAGRNLDKLDDRMKRNKIAGDGDNR